MRRAAALFVDMLPLDAAGRRAVDETMADWRYEADRASDLLPRSVVAVRNLLALVATLVRLIGRDILTLRAWLLAASVFGVAIVVSLLFSARPFVSYANDLVAHGHRGAPLFLLWASLLPQALSIALPLALLAPPVRRIGRHSLVGVAIVITLLSAFNLAWLTPAANQWFRETTYAMLRADAPVTSASSRVSRGLAEYTLADLISEVRLNGRADERVQRHLHSCAAILLTVPVAVLVGVQARRYTASRRWRYGGGGVAWLVMLSG